MPIIFDPDFWWDPVTQTVKFYAHYQGRRFTALYRARHSRTYPKFAVWLPKTWNTPSARIGAKSKTKPQKDSEAAATKPTKEFSLRLPTWNARASQQRKASAPQRAITIERSPRAQEPAGSPHREAMPSVF